MRNIYNVTKTPFQQEVRVALKCVCSLLNINGICFAIVSFQSYLCLHSLLPGFESRPGHVGKLPVTRSYVVVFAGYSGFLHYLQLASHELATIGINVTKNEIRIQTLVCRSFLVLKKTTVTSCLLWWTYMCQTKELKSPILLSLLHLSIHIKYLLPTFIEIVQNF